MSRRPGLSETSMATHADHSPVPSGPATANPVELRARPRAWGAPVTMEEAALRCAERGWRVFPVHGIRDDRCTCGRLDCSEPGKHPRITNWPNAATSDPVRIRAWWADWPDANIGGTTDKQFALDVDPANGGVESLARLEAQHGALPPTWRTETGSGGAHRFFPQPADGPPLRNSAGVLGPGLDTRGEGGYVVLPPSRHVSGRRYRWTTMGLIALAPAWLLSLLRQAPASGDGPSTVPEVIREGMRNSELYRLARALKAKGLSHRMIRTVLVNVNREQCEPPLSLHEVAAIAAHAALQPDRPEFTAAQPGARTVSLATIRAESVAWLWPGRLALGKLTLIIGDPDVGKSLLTMDVAARLSMGSPWPDGGAAPQGTTLLLTAEDGLADTVRPRVEALGGDATRIFALEAVRQGGQDRLFSLSADLGALEAECQRLRPLCVIFDPLSAYFGAKGDTWKDSDVRRVLSPLIQLATREQVAVLGLMHLTKAADRRAIARGLGSIAFVASGRIVLAVGRDPNEPDRRLLAPVKANLSTPPAVLAFSIEETHLACGPQPRIIWQRGSVAGVDAEQVLTGPRPPEERAAREEAVEFLTELFAAETAIESTIIEQAAKSHGIPHRALTAAKRQLGVRSERRGGLGKDGHWFWIRNPASHSPPSAEFLEADFLGENPAISSTSPKISSPKIPEPSLGLDHQVRNAKTRLAALWSRLYPPPADLTPEMVGLSSNGSGVPSDDD